MIWLQCIIILYVGFHVRNKSLKYSGYARCALYESEIFHPFYEKVILHLRFYLLEIVFIKAIAVREV